MSRHGHPLRFENSAASCPESGFRYEQDACGRVRCLDLDEDEQLPAELAEGKVSYDDWKSAR
jgi:UDP-2-acetamido-3-amino-2,3-dideoxy-glucuronate N-acetyltransferase